MSKNVRNIKIALVSPSRNFLSNPLMAEPLGLMYIEGVLRKLGVDVEMVDMSFDIDLPEADIYGFSASTVNFPQAVEYAKQVGDAYTIIGGPHSSALPEEAKEFFDAVVVGPGENAIVKILDDFSNNKKGCIYEEPIGNIDLIPIPPRTILERIKYNVFPGAPISASVLTSRGCPYRCAFCASNTIWGRRVYYHSVERVVEEIRYLRDKFDIKHFKFVDDTFTLNSSRFKRFSKAISKLDVKWLCDTRVNAVSDEVLDQMIDGGCAYVDLGIESVSDIVLDKVQKKQSSIKMKNAIAKIKSRGLKVKLYIIYGLPFETEDIVRQTIDFIEETDPDHVSLFTLVPYPGTDIWINPQKYNVKRIITDFGRYQHSVGGIEEELSWLPSIEYFDRSRERMREERNILKKFTIEWNRKKMMAENNACAVVKGD